MTCPFCNAEMNPQPPYCAHFIGWTDDGRTWIDRKDGQTRPLLATDRLVKTGVSVRVYRDVMFS